jgi:hypothetical protein
MCRRGSGLFASADRAMAAGPAAPSTIDAAARNQFPGQSLHMAALREAGLSYNDFVALARLCVRQARSAATEAAAGVLMRLAKDYQARAAQMRGGALPDIGEDLAPPASAIGRHPVQQQQQPQAPEPEHDLTPQQPRRPQRP